MDTVVAIRDDECKWPRWLRTAPPDMEGHHAGFGWFMAVGFILITTESGKERAVYDELTKVPEIVELLPLFGEYDLIAKVEAVDLDALGSVITQWVRPIPGVSSTKTLAGTKF